MAKNKLIAVLLAMVVTLAGITYYYWYQNANYVSTEDARIDGNIIKVSPQITGKILELAVEEGQYLHKNDYIGRQSDITLPAGSNLELTIIKAPTNGTVIKKIARTGEMGSPTAAVLMMVELKELYVTANIEEDKLERVKEGQLVDYTIDSLPYIKFQGHILSKGEAANSVFSLLPQQNTGNSFVKITQRVPVKISIYDYHNQRLLPGMNAIIRIHIK